NKDYSVVKTNKAGQLAFFRYITGYVLCAHATSIILNMFLVLILSYYFNSTAYINFPDFMPVE
ncbi:MAG: hypothetical protein ACTTKI_05630, partial [Tannerella sp.]|uniref:hypothetical protein n=1 Tax=Tannerella sp. TaxID=2382127 RepID=UPI003FA275D1